MHKIVIVAPNSENRSIGRVVSIVVGRPIVTGSDPACETGTGTFAAVGNFLDAPPLPNPPPPPALNSTATCVPNSCGGLSRISNSSNADLGFFVYVADADNRVIQVLNSNTSTAGNRGPTRP